MGLNNVMVDILVAQSLSMHGGKDKIGYFEVSNE
jgi:hypothetical protein